MVCPITNTDRQIPFHIRLSAESDLTGFVMVEQIKSVDYAARKVKLIKKAPADLLEQVLGVLEACLY
jgi:mRNA interferase MazF